MIYVLFGILVVLHIVDGNVEWLGVIAGNPMKQ